MENKINIAELLKDCPKGMELYSTIYGTVYFEGVRDTGNAVLIDVKTSCNTEVQFYPDGKFNTYYSDSEMTLFPSKDVRTWEGFVPPVEFKDGDILCNSKTKQPFILKFFDLLNNNVHSYCGIDGSNKFYTSSNNWAYASDVRLATEEEKAELFKAIKENGYKWNEETKKLKKVSQYPQTFEECCTVLGLTELGIIGGYRRGLLTQFRNLLICRDAYWKIANDWKFNFEEKCYYLCNEYHEIQDFNGVCDCNAVLAFPTAEMRDAFYENFKELINECKSLL